MTTSDIAARVHDTTMLPPAHFAHDPSTQLAEQLFQAEALLLATRVMLGTSIVMFVMFVALLGTDAFVALLPLTLFCLIESQIPKVVQIAHPNLLFPFFGRQREGRSFFFI